MENNNIHLDINQFEKIEDIIYLDEPILSHLKYNGKDFLLYLVDTKELYDYFLLIEIDEATIFEYLTNQISLFNLIKENKNFQYLIKQDFQGNTLNIQVTQGIYIDENYLPDVDSFLEYFPTDKSYYYEFINSYKANSYTLSLREHAFYLKFSSTSSKYADTIGLNELTNELLVNLSDSFENFLKADFFQRFKKIKPNTNKLQKIFKKLLPDLDFRMVDLKFGSFEVGLAIDHIMKSSIEDNDIKDWSIEVGNKYKKLVLDDDYDEATVEEIISNYDEEERRKIFTPIFAITENPNFNLEVKESKKSNYSIVKIRDKKVIEKIIPTKIEVLKTEKKDFEIVQFTTVLDKNLSSKTIKLENTLFNSTNSTDVVLTDKDFEKFGFSLKKEVSISAQISTNKDTVSLSAKFNGEVFEVNDHTGKIEELTKKLISKIHEYILNTE
ncbi:MAG: hypothetical protein BGO88_12025 [Flavobacterium sp. 38-13]|uniref:hypothetical protein n=1 Tax=Flavobacterium sp. 38-13 TaxID=1896168 RepID=UPI0009648DCB|nr:hypothetical protein [Flavobacterium sp. 38-13]OJX54369.1 MAG: hypothetical protein BGO88_12025 [Flavobacterium sp. 38-13]